MKKFTDLNILFFQILKCWQKCIQQAMHDFEEASELHQ